MTIPMNLLALLIGKTAYLLYRRVVWLDRGLGTSPLGPYVGQYRCVVGRRSDGS